MVTVERRHYLARSAALPEVLANAVRPHRAAENDGHGGLDVDFGEDRCRVREGTAACIVAPPPARCRRMLEGSGRPHPRLYLGRPPVACEPREQVPPHVRPLVREDTEHHRIADAPVAPRGVVAEHAVLVGAERRDCALG